MRIKQLLEQGRSAGVRNFGAVFLSLLLLAIFAQAAYRASAAEIVLDGLLAAGFLAFLWVPADLAKNRAGATVAAAVLWALMAIDGLAFGAYQTTDMLLFYLLGLIAFRLPGRLAILFAAGVIATDAAFWLLTHPIDLRGFAMYTALQVGAYGFFWGARTRSESNAARMEHFQEQSEMHARLEQAHRQLQAAHRELEEASARSLRYAVLEERSRIARDIHDSVGHGLTSVIVQLQALPYMIRSNPAEADGTLRTVLDVTRQCLTEVRSVVHQMAMDEAGLGLLALKSLVQSVREQSGLRIRFSAHGAVAPWHAETSELLYRVLQEALTNVIRHARATRVDVSVVESARDITMTITDDGAFAGDELPSPGFGLSSMRARCERAGGSFRLNALQPNGLGVTATVPLQQHQGGGGQS
jgi:signal transduction histidine kinase